MVAPLSDADGIKSSRREILPNRSPQGAAHLPVAVQKIQPRGARDFERWATGNSPLLVPIDLNIAGLCVLEFGPWNHPEADRFTAGYFNLHTTLGSTGAEMKTLFYSHLPIAFGKEMPLFKSLGQTLSVQISEVSAEK